MTLEEEMALTDKIEMMEERIIKLECNMKELVEELREIAWGNDI